MGRHSLTVGALVFTLGVGIWSWQLTRLERRGARDHTILTNRGMTREPRRPGPPEGTLFAYRPEPAARSAVVHPESRRQAPSTTISRRRERRQIEVTRSARDRFGFLARRDRLLFVLPPHASASLTREAHHLADRAGLSLTEQPLQKLPTGERRLLCLIGTSRQWDGVLDGWHPLPVSAHDHTPALQWVATEQPTALTRVARPGEPPGLFRLTGTEEREVAAAVRAVSGWTGDIAPLNGLPDVSLLCPSGTGVLDGATDYSMASAPIAFTWHAGVQGSRLTRFGLRVRRSMTVRVAVHGDSDARIWRCDPGSDGWLTGGRQELEWTPCRGTADTLWITGGVEPDAKVMITTPNFQTQVPLRQGDDLGGAAFLLVDGHGRDVIQLSPQWLRPNQDYSCLVEAVAGVPVAFAVPDSLAAYYRQHIEPTTAKPWSVFLRHDLVDKIRAALPAATPAYFLLSPATAATAGFSPQPDCSGPLLVDCGSFAVTPSATAVLPLLPSTPFLLSVSADQLAAWRKHETANRQHLLLMQLRLRRPSALPASPVDRC